MPDPTLAELRRHYWSKGLDGFELERAVQKHLRLLRPLDPEVAGATEADPSRRRKRRP